MTVGRNAKKLIVARAEVFPVFSQAHIVKANQVMALPSNDTICPNQITVNFLISLRLMSQYFTDVNAFSA